MSTIAAKVNARLLTKASRMFTGTLPGRIIEILQNARRAGAKHVVITNEDGTVHVRDDGRGVDTEALQRETQRAYVRSPRIHQDHVRHHSAPLVLGNSTPSRRNAMRNARPTDLKHASTM